MIAGPPRIQHFCLRLSTDNRREASGTYQHEKRQATGFLCLIGIDSIAAPVGPCLQAAEGANGGNKGSFAKKSFHRHSDPLGSIGVYHA